MIHNQQHLLSRRQGYSLWWAQVGGSRGAISEPNDVGRILTGTDSKDASDGVLRGDSNRHLNSAERFGVFVQHIVETVMLDAVWAETDERQLRRAVLDDLVDLFVSPRFHLLKRFVMTSPAVLTEEIADTKADRADFHPVLQPGGGRFRHFAMNAAAAEYYPPLLVNLAARTVGYDVPWRNDPSGDTEADLAANRIGRDFARYLKENAVGELAANAAVQRWVTARFSSG